MAENHFILNTKSSPDSCQGDPVHRLCVGDKEGEAEAKRPPEESGS